MKTIKMNLQDDYNVELIEGHTLSLNFLEKLYRKYVSYILVWKSVNEQPDNEFKYVFVDHKKYTNKNEALNALAEKIVEIIDD